MGTGGEWDLDPRTTAFVVIDMQNDFLDSAGYFARRGLDVARLARAVEPIARLREALPGEMRTLFTVQLYEPDGSDDLQRAHRLRPARLARSGGEAPCARGSWGAGIVGALAPRPQDAVVAKRRFDAFYQTDLELLLRCWGVKTLVFGGVVADVCVETSLRSAYVRDFDVVLAAECTAAWSDRDMRQTVRAVESHFGVSAANSRIIDALRRER
jgi:ureidoacrylate peracid hydrolase